MALQVYNTLTARKEEFKPLNPPNVNMYICGVTVYDYSHIGHARAYVAFDVIYRYLKYCGYNVTYARNFTDIDDKIIRRANEEGSDISAVSTRYIDAFSEDMAKLGLLTPDIEPRCTQYIEPMIKFIERLIEKGYAYAAPSGTVYYRIKKFVSYGDLSGKRLDDLMANASERLTSDEANEKEHPFDFALWKASKPNEPYWESPWGKGRPGWHIECSVMSTKNLGDTLDIHGGGKDLIFPHHENEIAQSEAYTGKPFAKYWLHNGFVNVLSDKGEETKMSKSLGNFFAVRDVLAAFHPQAIKFFMLSTNYRMDIVFSESGLAAAQKRVLYLYETLEKVDKLLASAGVQVNYAGELIEQKMIDGLIPAIEEAMDDDFNSQKAISVLSEPFKLMNALTDKPKGHDKNKLLATLYALRMKINTFASIFGLLDRDPAEVISEIKRLSLKFLNVTEDEINAAMEARAAARKEKNFAESDRIRDELAAKGIVIKDTPTGAVWTIKTE